LNQSILEKGKVPTIALPDADQGLDGILFWHRYSLAWDAQSDPFRQSNAPGSWDA